jgi:ABC-type transporter Mla subunit MlaD
MSRIATRLRNEETDVRQECELLLQFLDTTHQHWQATASWLDSAEVLASGVGRVTEALVSSDFGVSRQDSTGVAAARDVQAYADSVANVLAKVQSMRGELIEHRDSGALAREAVLALADRVIGLERALDHLAGGLEPVAAKVAATRTASAEQGRRFHRWTLVVTLVASVLPVWFGISQIVMMAHGWRMAHSNPRSIQPR